MDLEIFYITRTNFNMLNNNVVFGMSFIDCFSEVTFRYGPDMY